MRQSTKHTVSDRAEREAQRSICKYLKLCGIAHTVNEEDRQRRSEGGQRVSRRRKWPNITAVLPGGRALFIEVRNQDRHLTPAQEKMMERLRAQGAVAITARCASDVHQIVTQSLLARL